MAEVGKNRRAIRLVPPPRHTGLRVSKPPEVAAGLPAVRHALADIREEVGSVRGLRLLGRVNQTEGFDCPGCAWPDPHDRSRLGEYCENGAKAVAEEATQKRVDRSFFARHTVEELSTWTDYELGKSGRITEPFILRADSSRYEPISWSDAYEKVAASLHLARESGSADRSVFYTSGRTSNEAAFLYQLFVRRYGTNNLPDCSNMCHESSGAGLTETIGIGKGTVTLEDLHEADVILVIGQNPGTNHPRMLSALQRCKENGGSIVGVNPITEVGTSRFANPQKMSDLRRRGTPLADLHVPLRTNTDVAFLKAVAKLLIDADDHAPGAVLDRRFIDEHTTGFDRVVEDLATVDVAEMAKVCGVDESLIRQVADLLVSTKKIIVTWAMGITQHENAVANVHQIVNLLLMKGAIGRPGAGVCPVRGHSNVQGDRTMGIWEKMPERFLSRLDQEFGFVAPREHGFDVVQSIEAMRDGMVSVFMAMGGNFASATPDSELTAKALMACDLTVQVSTKLNRSHIVTGAEAIILPCLGRTERDVQAGERQFVTVENSMGVVHSSTGSAEPASTELRSEPQIVCELAEMVEGLGSVGSDVDWVGFRNDYDRIRGAIERCVDGFDQYNERARLAHGFLLPNGPREGVFPEGGAKFMVDPIRTWDLDDDQFLMMTIRSHDQFNTTVYGLDDRYRGVEGERRVVFMNPDDMSEHGFTASDRVDIVGALPPARVAADFLIVPGAIAAGCVATYFPEANVLIPIEQTARGSNTPASKSVVVSIAAHRSD